MRDGLGGAGALGVGAFALAGCARPGADAGLVRCPDDTSAPAEAGPSFSELTGFCEGEGLAAIEASEYEARIERARAGMREAGRGALVIEAGPDQRYFCGLTWRRSDRPVLLCLPLSGAPFLVGAEFEAQTMRRRMGPLALELRTWTPAQTVYELATAGLREGLAAGQTIGLGGTDRAFVMDGLRGAGSAWSFAGGRDVIDGCRMTKSATELGLLRRANEATQAALAAASAHAVEGQTESELAALVRAAQQSAGLEDVWVLAQFGESAAEPHGSATERRLQEGDLILIDTGGFLHGYASDITRTFAYGPASGIDDRRRRAWDAVLAAQSAGLAAIRPGVPCSQVDAAARAVIDGSGFGTGYEVFSHRLGHGIGIEVHEHPYLSARSPHTLGPGMTMSDEPGIYVAGDFGVRIEDIVVVTQDGAQAFGTRAQSLERPFGPPPSPG